MAQSTGKCRDILYIIIKNMPLFDFEILNSFSYMSSRTMWLPDLKKSFVV